MDPTPTTTAALRDRAAGLLAELTGAPPAVMVRSPGRVNLIGDHTDYNDGFVLPMAIEHATWVAASPRDDGTVRVVSEAEGSATLDLGALAKAGDWTDYVAGTLWALGGEPGRGFDAAIVSNVPIGSGLSSSASLELGVSRVAHELWGRPWDPVVAALAARKAENEFVGVPTGIMDQLIVATAVEGHATLIDCRDLSLQASPLPDDALVVILDTGTRRGLVDSAYAERREACERVAAAVGVPALRDVELADLDSVELDPTDYRRAQHVITENERTVEAARALVEHDARRMGELMNDSHRSLRDWFETSGPALDVIVEAAVAHPACLGARVTGAGFAGAAVAVVEAGGADDFVASVGSAYDQTTGHTSALYVSHAAPGVELL